jgi:hypothetical protein
VIYNNEVNQRARHDPRSSFYQHEDEQADVCSYGEMLRLGEECARTYQSIEQELSKPSPPPQPITTVSYVPVMKKRVYRLNGAYLNNAVNNTSDQPHHAPPVATSTAATSSENLYACNLKREETITSNNKKLPPLSNYEAQGYDEEEESSDNILNYLIGRLSEQHKTKLQGEFFFIFAFLKRL